MNTGSKWMRANIESKGKHANTAILLDSVMFNMITAANILC